MSEPFEVDRQTELIRQQQRETWEDYDEPETRQCTPSCAHFDSLNQCCWLITERTPGLFTDVREYDYCFHGLKEEY